MFLDYWRKYRGGLLFFHMINKLYKVFTHISPLLENCPDNVCPYVSSPPMLSSCPRMMFISRVCYICFYLYGCSDVKNEHG